MEKTSPKVWHLAVEVVEKTITVDGTTETKKYHNLYLVPDGEIDKKSYVAIRPSFRSDYRLLVSLADVII